MPQTGNDIRIEIGLVGDEAIIKGFGKIEKSGKKAGKGLSRNFDKAGKSIGFFNQNVMEMATGFVIANVGMQTLTGSARFFKDEIILGLSAVEEMNIQIASMAAFISTFSQKSKEGDIAGGFEEALGYAQALIPALEIMDAKTISTGKDLTIMVETMAQNGVVLDINNKKQEQGFINIANALKLVTAGQNFERQGRQEINALMTGQVRMTDRLPKLLQAIDPQIKEHIKQWKEEGTLIENVGKLLEGFEQSGDLIERSWTAIGSTMETIHTRILRGGMKPMYEDLLDLSEDINRSLMEEDGLLTNIGQQLQGVIAVSWVDIKNTLGTINNLLMTIEGPLKTIGQMVGTIFDGWGMIFAILEPVSRRLGLIGKAVLPLVGSDFAGAAQAWADSGSLMGEAFAGGLQDEIGDKLFEREAAKDIGKGKTIGEVVAPQLASTKDFTAQVGEDKKILGKRLKEFEKFYNDINQQMERHYQKEKQNLLDLNSLYKQQMDLRRSTEEMLIGLGKEKTRTAEEEFNLSRAEIDKQYQAALKLGGQDQIDALEQYKQAVSSLAQEFKEGFGYTEGSEIAEQAISDIERAYELQKQVMTDLTTASEEQIETNRIWGEELELEMIRAEEGVSLLKDTIAELDDQIQLMDQVLTIEAEDRASSVVNNIEREIDRLHDKTITITTVHREIYSGSGADNAPVLGSFAIGTDWVPKTGLYRLHEGEKVVPAAENKGGGGAKAINFGDIIINNQGGGDPSRDVDYRRLVRDDLMPEIMEQLNNV